MKNIIEKLDEIDEIDDKNWTLEEKLELLQIYSIISSKEHYIFDLIYKHHSCDSWEDIFRDYNVQDLYDKSRGVKIAIKDIENKIKENKK
jgi:hypothetical protein